MSDVFAQVSWIACGYYHSALVTVSGVCPHILIFSYLHFFIVLIFIFLYIPSGELWTWGEPDGGKLGLSGGEPGSLTDSPRYLVSEVYQGKGCSTNLV